MLLGSHPLPAAEPAPVLAEARDSRTTEVSGSAALPITADVGWLQPSLTSPAYAGPVAEAPGRMAEDDHQVPLTTGAWLMGCGLVVFVISRKRFRS